jgi:hypothetical protein
MRTHALRKLPAVLFGITLAMSVATATAADDPYPRLPGEPQVQPAENGRLSEGEAINLAVNWAKFGKNPDVNTVIDTAITAISVGYPPAGIALGVAKGFIMGLAGGPDPVAEALKIMDKRIAALERNVSQLATALEQMNDKVLNIENRIRIGELQSRRDQIANLKGALTVLHERTPSAREKAEFTKQVMRLAARFRPDSEFDNDMWQWSDLKVATDRQTGQLKSSPMQPDFKTLPLLESYVNALVLLMAAIQYEGRDLAYVKATYHDELMRHVQALSVRPYWLEGDPQYTLAERLMSRVNCVVNSTQKYPENGMCSARYAMCYDTLARRTKTVSSGIEDWSVNNPNTLCTPTTTSLGNTMRPADRAELEQKWEARSDQAPWGSDALLRVRQYTGYSVPAEEFLEDFHGLETMTLLADRLYKLAVTGTLMEPPVYSFDHTYWDKEYLYGVKKSGELVWFGHLIGEDRNPPKKVDPRFEVSPKYRSSVLESGARTDVAAGSKTRGLRDTAVTARSGAAVTPRKPNERLVSGAFSGAKEAITQIDKIVPPDYRIIHNWEGPKTVGSGWQNFRDVIPAAITSVSTNSSGASFYGVTPDGALLWYRHDGFVYGEPRWKGPVRVGSGWQSFTKIIPAGDGVLYAIGVDGSLRWYRHQDVADPAPEGAALLTGSGISRGPRIAGRPITAPSHWLGPNVVNGNWGHFVHVFSTGEGVIYAVDPQGKLWWYKHKGYLTGSQEWDAPKQVGEGWAGFKKVFSPSEGYIYAQQPSGEMLWYQHLGYQDGTVRWRGPTAIGAAWGDYALIFSAMHGTPQAPVVR